MTFIWELIWVPSRKLLLCFAHFQQNIFNFLKGMLTPKPSHNMYEYNNAMPQYSNSLDVLDRISGEFPTTTMMRRWGWWWWWWWWRWWWRWWWWRWWWWWWWWWWRQRWWDGEADWAPLLNLHLPTTSHLELSRPFIMLILLLEIFYCMKDADAGESPTYMCTLLLPNGESRRRRRRILPK